MNQTLAYEQLIEKFIKWGEAQADIRAAIVVGSRARANRPADEWLDCVVEEQDPT